MKKNDPVDSLSRHSAKGLALWYKALSPLRKAKLDNSKKSLAKAAVRLLSWIEELASDKEYSVKINKKRGEGYILFPNNSGYHLSYLGCYVGILDDGKVVDTVLAQTSRPYDKKEYISIVFSTSKEFTGACLLSKDVRFQLAKTHAIDGIKELIREWNYYSPSE